MFGLLNINKPFDVTSRDVVNHVQRYSRPHKVGHAGTLDPLATGVLVVCVGKATRLVDFVQDQPKRYVGTFILGCTSETEDTEGELVEIPSAPCPSRAEVEQVLPRFIGEILQRPPVYSALKVHGRRAYSLARRGQEVELKARPVSIQRLEIVDYVYPQLTLDITCGSGTYIRSLGRDIGESLASGAVMSALERRAIGNFVVEQSCTMSSIDEHTIGGLLQPALRAVEHLPTVPISAAEVEELSHGRSIDRQLAPGVSLASAIDDQGKLVAILIPARGGGLRPQRNFCQA